MVGMGMWTLSIASLVANSPLPLDDETHYLYDAIIAVAFIVIAVLGIRNRRHRRELLTRDRRLKRLLELSWRLEQARDYGAILGAASDVIREEIGFNTSWIFLAKSGDPDLVYLLADRSMSSVDIRGKHPTLSLDGDPMLREIRDSHHPVVVEDAWADPRTDKDQVAKNNNRTIINVPMITSDRRLGCLGTGTFGDEGTRRLTAEEIAFIEDVAKRLCPSLDRLEQYADRLRAERESRRLSAAIDQTAEGVALADPDGTIRYCNPSFSLLLDKGRDELVGNGLPLVEQVGVVGESVAAGRRWRGRVAHRRNDGETVELDLSLTPVRDEEDEISAIVAVVADASDETRLDRARSFFASVTSHELRTPLTKLTMALPFVKQVMEGTNEGSVVLPALGQAVEGIAQVVTATSILSALQRGEGDEGPAQLFDLKSALTALVEKTRMRSATAGRALSLSFDWAPSSRHLEVTAPTLLTAAVEELLSNAVKYSPDGSTARLMVIEEEGGVVIEVTDQGPGMSIDEIEQAADPFFSLERPELHSSGRYSYQGGGIGLGLTIAKMVTEYLGGRIELGRRAEGGLLVRMRLPCPVVSLEQADRTIRF